ncbi:MAG: SMC-Scp complex subunit ScpB [Candidatus Omnitrophica bacterium]|nr:SMC-Scp complex subunit ScpB [Candidatus Omnitrophota bacterium]
MEDATVNQTMNTIDESLQHVQGVIESLLFVNESPVTLEQIKKVLETVSPADIKKAILNLQSGYETRKSGVMIVEIAGGYQMLSNPAYASYLRSFYKTKHKEKLSKPALESMAIIAYKQPVTRLDIELIRGVNSDGVIAHLLSKELIKVVGRKDVPGRPFVYGTTKQFLEYFGLKSLDDLPTLEEFPTLQPAQEANIVATDMEETAQGESSSGNEDAGTHQGQKGFPRIQDEQAGVMNGAEQEDQSKKFVDSEKSTEEMLGEAQEQDLKNEPEQSTQKN